MQLFVGRLNGRVSLQFNGVTFFSHDLPSMPLDERVAELRLIQDLLDELKTHGIFATDCIEIGDWIERLE